MLVLQGLEYFSIYWLRRARRRTLNVAYPPLTHLILNRAAVAVIVRNIRITPALSRRNVGGTRSTPSARKP